MPQNKSLLELEEEALRTGEVLLQRGKAVAQRLATELPAATKKLSGLSTAWKRVLITAGVIGGVIIISYMLGIPQWLKQRHETHQWVVTNKVTPEVLVKRCGTPLTDQTKDLYPMVARDMSYKSAAGGTIVFKFSRTAEEGSDWVFMSMQDAATGASYDTPVEKITAMSCLDSSKY